MRMTWDALDIAPVVLCFLLICGILWQAWRNK